MIKFRRRKQSGCDDDGTQLSCIDTKQRRSTENRKKIALNGKETKKKRRTTKVGAEITRNSIYNQNGDAVTRNSVYNKNGAVTRNSTYNKNVGRPKRVKNRMMAATSHDMENGKKIGMLRLWPFLQQKIGRNIGGYEEQKRMKNKDVLSKSNHMKNNNNKNSGTAIPSNSVNIRNSLHLTDMVERMSIALGVSKSDEYDTHSTSSDSIKRGEGIRKSIHQWIDPLLGAWSTHSTDYVITKDSFYSSSPSDDSASFAEETASRGGKKPNVTESIPNEKKKRLLSNKLRSVRKRVSIVHDKWFRFLCQRRFVCALCDTVFDTVDVDKAGVIDENELYQGLLLIHLKIGVFAGSAACRPISREQCSVLFTTMDRDNTGVLDKMEFREVMMVFFGNILSRILVQWMITILIVPLIAQYVTRSCRTLLWAVIGLITMSSCVFISHITGISFIETNKIGVVLNNTELQNIPSIGTTNMKPIFESAITMIPEKVLHRTPLIIVSTLLGTLVVPIIIYNIDSIFQSIANSRAKKAPVQYKK